MLTAVFLQFFILFPLQNMAKSSENYVLHQKLDNIWVYIGSAVSNHLNAEKVTTLTNSFFERNKDWERLSYDGALINWQEQAAFYMVAAVFIIGAGLEIFGRYSELRANSRRA